MSSRLIKVQQNMETRLGDVTGLLDRILTAVSIDGNQGRDEAQASRAQAAGGGQAAGGDQATSGGQATGEGQATGGGQVTGGAQAMGGAQANETQANGT